MPQVDKRPMQILLNNLNVFLESYVVLDVIFSKSDAHKQSIVKLFIHTKIIAYEILPGFTSDLHGYTFLECISESSSRCQIDFVPDLW